VESSIYAKGAQGVDRALSKSRPQSHFEEAMTTTLRSKTWEAIKKELAKLLATGFIKEVYHPEWLANPLLVLKKSNNE
jgi:hypothetical protein